MNRTISFAKTNSQLVINITGKKPVFIELKTKRLLADEAIKLINAQDVEGLISLLDKKQAVTKWSDSNIYVDDNDIVRMKMDKSEIPDAIAKKIIAFHDEGLPYQPLINFWINLRRNPSKASIEQLFGFLESNHHPITPDGKFIAYKKVTKLPDGRHVDGYTRKLPNEVGDIVQMNRDNVDPDPNRTCSTGLHVASWEYAQGYPGNVLVEVEVHPKDVVAVPRDYNNQKMRTCEYKVRSKYEDDREISGQLVDWETGEKIDLNVNQVDLRIMKYQDIENLCKEQDSFSYPKKINYASGSEFIAACTRFLSARGFTVITYYGVTNGK